MKTSVPQRFSPTSPKVRLPGLTAASVARLTPPGARWEAAHLGIEAARIAAALGSNGVVVSATSRAIYVESGDGAIFGMGSETAAAHTRMIVVAPGVSGGLPATEPGVRVTFRWPNLVLGSAGFVDLSCVTAKSGPLAAPGGVAPSRVAARSVVHALAAAAGSHSGDNLGLLLKGMSNDTTHSPAAATRDVILNSAIEHARKVILLCRSGPLAEVAVGLGPLIGLGQGLTPSGDDFAGGLLFSVSHLARAYGPASPWGPVDPASALLRWQGRTNRISHAYLRDFALGQGPFPMHGLMGALLGGGDGPETGAYIRRIEEVSRIGHASGWDMLSGMFAGLLPLADEAGGPCPGVPG